jgi:hypothetical protein
VDSTADELLMLRVRDGEVETLGVLYERHRTPLFNFFVRLTGGIQVSEDSLVMQTALLFVYCMLSYSFSVVAEDVQEKQTIERTFTFSATGGTQQVEVDDFEGSIKVSGYNGREVQLVAQETLEADLDGKAQEARREVRLEITQINNAIRCYVDGPFRCKNGSVNFRGWEQHGYKVGCDFEIKVPQETMSTQAMSAPGFGATFYPCRRAAHSDTRAANSVRHGLWVACREPSNGPTRPAGSKVCALQEFFCTFPACTAAQSSSRLATPTRYHRIISISRRLG